MSTPVVLITGALTGIGRATAIAFAKEVARLVISGRNEAEGKCLSQGGWQERRDFRDRHVSTLPKPCVIIEISQWAITGGGAPRKNGSNLMKQGFAAT
jgi:NAD(P)-dependent dehydrogenase (short-subunit alcohol dehydrogenase family)